MSRYIETSKAKGKAAWVCENLSGEILPPRATFSETPPDKVLIIVVDNGPFEACAHVDSPEDFQRYTRPDDLRPKTYIYADKVEVLKHLETQRIWKRG